MAMKSHSALSVVKFLSFQLHCNCTRPLIIVIHGCTGATAQVTKSRKQETFKAPMQVTVNEQRDNLLLLLLIWLGL